VGSVAALSLPSCFSSVCTCEQLCACLRLCASCTLHVFVYVEPETSMCGCAGQLGVQMITLHACCCCCCCFGCADQLGVQPGAEFRAAAEAAAAVPGGQCCLVLGDRPIEITLSRAWEALSWRRRLQLLADLAAAGMMSSQQVTTSTAQHSSLVLCFCCWETL
jgi:hypothetical protein